MTRRTAALFAFAALLAPSGAAAMGEAERTARRDAADYHALFELREVAPPAAPRADGSGRCRARGVAHILFRGPRDLETGRPLEVFLRCGTGASGAEEAVPPLYDYADPAAPRRLIVWLHRFEELFVAVDWVAPGF